METYKNAEFNNNNNKTTSYDSVTINKCSGSYENKVPSPNATYNSIKPRVRAIGLQVKNLKNLQQNSAFRNLETGIQTAVAHREAAGCTHRCNGIHCSVYQCDYGHDTSTYNKFGSGCTCFHRNTQNWFTPLSSYQNSCNRASNYMQESNEWQLVNFPLPANYHCREPVCFRSVSLCNHAHSSTQPYYGHGFHFNTDKFCGKWCSEKKNMCNKIFTSGRNEMRSSAKVQHHTKSKVPLNPSKSKNVKQAQKQMVEKMSNTSSLDKYNVNSKEKVTHNEHSFQRSVSNNVTSKKLILENAKEANHELLVGNYKPQQNEGTMDLISPKTDKKKRETYEEYLKKYKSEHQSENEPDKKKISNKYTPIQSNEMFTEIQKGLPPHLQYNTHKKVNNTTTMMTHQEKSEQSSSLLKSQKQLPQENQQLTKTLNQQSQKYNINHKLNFSKPQSDMQLKEPAHNLHSKSALNFNFNCDKNTFSNSHHDNQLQHRDNQFQPRCDKIQQQIHNPNYLIQDHAVESYGSHHHLSTIQYDKQYIKDLEKIQRLDKTSLKPSLNFDDQPFTSMVEPKFCEKCQNVKQHLLHLNLNDQQIMHNRQFEQNNAGSHLFNYNCDQVDRSNMHKQWTPPLNVIDSNPLKQYEYFGPDQEVFRTDASRSQYNKRKGKDLSYNNPKETTSSESFEKKIQKIGTTLGIEEPKHSVVLEEQTNNQNFECSEKKTRRRRRNDEFYLPTTTEEAIKTNTTKSQQGEKKSYYQHHVSKMSNLKFQSQNYSVAKSKESGCNILNSESKQMTFRESYVAQAPSTAHNKERNFYQGDPNVSFSIPFDRTARPGNIVSSVFENQENNTERLQTIDYRKLNRNRYYPLHIANYSNPDECSCNDFTDGYHSTFRTTSSCATIPIYLDTNDEDYRTCDESLYEDSCEVLPILHACSCMYNAYLGMASHCKGSKINRCAEPIRLVSANDFSQ